MSEAHTQENPGLEGLARQAELLAADPAAPGAGQIGAGQAEPIEIAPPSAQALQVAGMLIGALRPLACYLLPTLKRAPDECWEPVPAGVAGVLDHLGIGSSEFVRSPWGRLAVSLAPLGLFALAASAEKEPEKKEGGDGENVLA